MDIKDWKQYDPEHLKYIQTMIDDPYTDVPKQDVIFLMDRLQQATDRERVLREALEKIHKITVVKSSLDMQGTRGIYLTAKEALEASR